MPLVICRACKSYAGKAINYITEKNKAERITTYGLDETRSFAKQFIDTGLLHGKGDTYDERKYYHIKISFEPKDRIENGGKLDAELAEKIAREYFEKQYGQHEFILATHTDKEHIHCHAIINAVSFENGKKIQHSNKNLADMKDQVNDVAEKYGVSRFDWRQAVKTKRQKAKAELASEPKELTQSEKYIQERHGEEWSSSSWKETLRDKIDEAKGQCTNRNEFEKYLLDYYGIEMPRNTTKTVSFKHPAVGETVRGVKLGAEYTAESIDRALSENNERSMNHARLRITEERTDRATAPRIGGADTGTDNKIVARDTNTANDGIGSRADESGERGIKTNTGELYGKLQEIRELNKQYNPGEQRRTAEADKRTAQQTRTEADRLANEQRRGKQKHKRRSQDDER
jgi:hypothetical protein